MRTKLTAVAALVPILIAAAAHADSPSDARAARASSTVSDAEAYCAWVRSAAASESDTLLFPSIYATAGYTSGADASTNAAAASTLAPTQRLIVGGAYSLGAGGLNQGIAIRSRAAAECRLYETMSALRAFIENHRDGATRGALTAKVRVLEEALPRATEILAGQSARLAQARATVDDVSATSLRVDGLRKLAGDTRAQLEATSALPNMPGGSIHALLNRRDLAEEEAERSAAYVRQSRGWDLSLRGGYDRIFGVRDYTPVFAMATLSLNVGLLFQGGSDREAVRARRRFARSEVLGVDDRVEQALQLLRATRASDVARLRDTRVLLLDMEARFKDIAVIPGDRARAFADALWFDLIRTRAEHAYLEENVRALATLLDEGAQ